MWGTSTSSPPTDPAASTAVLASSVSRAMVNTIPGSTTPEVSGSNGNVWFRSVMVFPGPSPAPVAPQVGDVRKSLFLQTTGRVPGFPGQAAGPARTRAGPEGAGGAPGDRSQSAGRGASST